MDSTLALLFSLLHVLSVCSAAPLPGEVVKMKSKVKWMAEQLVVRLNKDVQVMFMVLFVGAANLKHLQKCVYSLLNCDLCGATGPGWSDSRPTC